MTRKDAILYMILKREELKNSVSDLNEGIKAFDMAIKALKQEPCEDAISRQDVLDYAQTCSLSLNWDDDLEIFCDEIKELPSITSQSKIGYCKDCKWWKDSDGIFRRGIDAESQCPMNRIEVFEGNGYCYMFESQKSEE